jgi:hypothetical protein
VLLAQRENHWKKWKLPEKPSKRHMCGGEVPNAADIAPKNQKHPRPHVLERRVVATCSNTDGGEEPEHDGESFGEARARRGGPKTRRSTTQEAHEPNSHTQRHGGNHRNGDVGKDLNKPARPQAGCEHTGEYPTTEIYTQQKKTPKLKDSSEEEKLREPRPERNQKRREGG